MGSIKILVISFFLIIGVFGCQKKREITEYTKEEKQVIDSIQKYSYNTPDRAILYLHKLLKQVKTPDKKKDVYGALAYNHKTKNIKDSTLYYFYKGLSLCKKPEDIINYKYEIGIFYEERYKYKEALILYKECYDLAKKEKSLAELKKIEHALKLLKNKVSQSEEALLFLGENYKKEKDKATGVTDKNIRYIRKDFIEALVSRKHVDKALFYIEEGIVEASTRNNIEFLFFLFKLKAEAYLQKEDIQQAIEASDQVLIYTEKLKNQKFINEANYLQAQIKEKLNEPEAAISLIQKVLVNNEEKSVEQFSNYYKVLAACYEQIDSTTLSVEYYKKHTDLKDSVTNKRIALINRIDKIGLDQEVLARQKQESKTLYWTIAFIILFFMGLIFLIINRKTQKSNQKKFDDLLLKIEASEKEKEALKAKHIADKKSTVENIKDVVLKQEETLETLDIIEKDINDEKVREILLKIKNLEDKHYFLRQDCTLHNMAKKLKTNTTYLSKIFNNHLEKTFSTYLNDLRINYIILELKNNKRIRAYSTKAISEDLGYKTVYSFSKYFKQTTGISPSVYIKKLQKNE